MRKRGTSKVSIDVVSLDWTRLLEALVPLRLYSAALRYVRVQNSNSICSSTVQTLAKMR